MTVRDEGVTVTERGVRRLAVRCDVGPSLGVGHLMRCLALSEELVSRGHEVTFVCDSKAVPWADEQLAARGISAVPPVSSPVEHVDVFRRLEVEVVVFDSYHLPASVYRAVRDTGFRTLALVDKELRGAEADILLDQNIGAEDDEPWLPGGAVRLAGLPYALLRDEVLSHRPEKPPTARQTDRPKVLIFFGGTDVTGAAPLATELLAATGLAFEATVVVAREELRSAIDDVRLDDRQHVNVIGPTDRLASLVIGSDVVISAAGSSAWELMCLGASPAVLCVADNQAPSYARLAGTKAALGLGSLEELRSDPVGPRDRLTELMASAEMRTTLARTGWAMVDGAGRQRVADALLSLEGGRA